MRSQKARDALERRAHALSPFPPLLLPVAIRRQPLLLGGDELAGFWHLPAASLGAQIAWLPNRRLPAAPHAFHSQPSSRQARCIVLGYAEQADGTLAPVGPALRDLRQIMHVTAGMGAGKSRLLANLARQMFETGLFLIDGKGDDAGNLAHTVARLVPREDEHRLVWLDIADRDWPIGINPLAAYDPMQPGALDQLVSMLEATFARLDPETWRQAPGMQQFLGHAARLTCQAQPGATLLHLQRLLIDETYRDALLRLAPETDATRFWRQVFPRMPESQRGSLLALLRRFEKLLGSELLRGMLSQPRSTIDLTRIFDERLIVLCPIPHVTYGSLAGTAATLLFMLFVRAAFARPGSAETRADYPLVVDELQVLVEQGATQDVSLALTQLRSLGVPAVYAHQTLGQLGDLRDVLLVNAENRVIIRTQEPDASVYARQYAASGLTASDISEQEPHSHQYARFLVEGRPVPPCSIVPLPWPVGPGEEETATQHHHDWRAIVPPGSAAQQQYDRSVARMIYAPYHPGVTRQLAAVDDSDWALFCERWHAIAATQRAALLCNRARAPHTAERQRWLSRLAYARPRLLVEAEQARLR